MAVEFTYGGDPEKSASDAVRFYCGDTNKRRPLLDNKEIRFAIANEGNSRLAAATCCEAIAAKFASIPDTRVGDVSKAFGKVSESFRQRAKDLRAQACIRAGVSFPAISVTDKKALEDNRDLVRPAFAVGQLDNPWAVQPNRTLENFGPFSGF